MEIQGVYEASGYYNTQFTHEAARLSDASKNNGENFVIEDLLNIPNEENMFPLEAAPDLPLTGTSPDDSNAMAPLPGRSRNSSVSPTDSHYLNGAQIGAPSNFSSELCIPSDDLADLEWLSHFSEEPFSSEEDLQKMQLIQGMKGRGSEASEIHHYQFKPETTRPGPVFRPEMAVPGKARSKRSRAAPGNWTSRLLVVSPTPSVNTSSMSSASESDITTVKKFVKPGPMKKREGPDNSSGGDGRKCLHCATDKTPQWRTGPMGPKTLCNACGVRYKSGRLVPEYRPASSPSFVLTKHSNSHRKVLELRRQKEMQRAQQQQQQFLHHHHHPNMMYGHVPSNPDDYLIHHQHIGHDYRQLI